MQGSGWIAAAAGLLLSVSAQAQTPSPAPAPAPSFEVSLDAPVTAPVSGRLIIVAIRPEERFRPARGQTFTEEELTSRLSQFLPLVRVNGIGPTPSPSSATITTATNVTLAPGEHVDVRTAATYPQPAVWRRGVYFVQAILDTDGNFAYDNKPSPGDLVSEIIDVAAPTPRIVLPLKTVVAPVVHSWDMPPPNPNAPGASPQWLEQAKARYQISQETSANAARVNIPSHALTAFHGRAVGVRAYILTPPGYAAGAERYPTVFRTEGFGANFNGLSSSVEQVWQDMVAGKHPPMIWIFLDHSGPTGTHEFADSANNGPWGQALTEEFIPWLDAHYRTDPAARFAIGHSSGGWSALWLQVRYPKLFAGAWPLAPDPVDFHNFTNVDIYAPGANAYRNADGSPVALQRVYRSTNTVPFRAYAELEDLLGDHGGQLSSFDWVFSPKGPDGKPTPLFDHKSGAVDPKVAAYWRDNYDISHIIRRDWARLKPDLDGKIHLWVGTLDTYHLEGAARLLKATLDDLGATSDFHFIEGADHSTFTVDIAPNGAVEFGGLERRLAWQMYRQARPNSTLTEPAKPAAGAS